MSGVVGLEWRNAVRNLLIGVLGGTLWLAGCGNLGTNFVPPTGPGTEGQTSGVVLEEQVDGVWSLADDDQFGNGV